MLRGLYKTEVCTIQPDATLKEAAKLMRDRNVGDVVVVDPRQAGKGGGRVPIGILTDRDIVISCVAADNVDFMNTKVSDIMSKNIAFVKEDAGLLDAIRKMRAAGVGRIVVVDDNKTLMGILTSTNIFDLLNEELHELSAIAHSKRQPMSSQPAEEGGEQRQPPNLTPDQAQGLRH